MALLINADRTVGGCWHPRKSAVGAVMEAVAVLRHSWTTEYATAVTNILGPVAEVDSASPHGQELSEDVGLLAAREDTLCVEKAPGWCHGRSYATQDRDVGHEGHEGHEDDKTLSYCQDLALRDELGARLASEGSSMSDPCSEPASGRCGPERPSAVPHGWCANVGLVAFPSDLLVGHRHREDQPAHKDSAAGSD